MCLRVVDHKVYHKVTLVIFKSTEFIASIDLSGSRCGPWEGLPRHWRLGAPCVWDSSGREQAAALSGTHMVTVEVVDLTHDLSIN